MAFLLGDYRNLDSEQYRARWRVDTLVAAGLIFAMIVGELLARLMNGLGLSRVASAAFILVVGAGLCLILIRVPSLIRLANVLRPMTVQEVRRRLWKVYAFEGLFVFLIAQRFTIPDDHLRPIEGMAFGLYGFAAFACAYDIWRSHRRLAELKSEPISP